MSLYIPPAFMLSDQAAIDQIMADHPFATLITPIDDDAMISHVPILAQRDEQGALILHFHLARANPHVQALGGGRPAIAVFHGPHTYISPQYYQSRQEVPTWNYITVHATGRPMELNRDASDKLLTRLTGAFESGANRWQMDEVAPDRMDRLHGALQGFVMPVTRLEAKAKLSQNKSNDDRAGVVKALALSDKTEDQALAKAMTTGA
jgi:transcriptional regulator